MTWRDQTDILSVAVHRRAERSVAEREDHSGITRLHRLERNLPSATLGKAFRDLHAKDQDIYEHGYRVALVAVMIAEKMGLSEERLSFVAAAAWLHDIGKLHVPKQILRKGSALDDREYFVMMRHVDFGGVILRDLGSVGYAQVAEWHHERYDGNGYNKMKHRDICLEAQITSVADAYDAIVSSRCYRGGRCHEAAVAEVRRCMGAQFHPLCAEAFLAIEGEVNDLRQRIAEGAPELPARLGLAV
jgi:putative nucleotidyltransferase with HDIG domain